MFGNNEFANSINKASAKLLQKPNPVLVGLIVVIFVSIFVKGWVLGLDTGASNRIRFHAIPVALAVAAHGLPHDYTSRITIAHRFQDESRPLKDLIAEARKVQVSDGNAVYFWAADDRGMADYVIAAFRLFGYSEGSLYLFYFVVLGISCAAYIIAFRRDTRALGLLALTLVGLWTYLSVLPLANERSFLTTNATADAIDHVALFETRIFDALALVATLHVALFAFSRSRPTWPSVGWIAVQAFVFFFLYHARSSLGWMLVAIVLLLLIAVGGNFQSADAGSAAQRLAAPAVAAAVMFVMALGVTAYKHLTYHPRYFAELGPRTFWHNALMGLGSDAELRETYGLEYEYGLEHDDGATADAVIRYATRIEGIVLPDDWNRGTILLSLGSHRNFDWKAYERYARRFYFYLWRKHPLPMLRTYMVTKPIAAAAIVSGAVLPNPERRSTELYRRAFGLYFEPFAGTALLMAALPLIVLFRRLRQSREELLIVGVLLACSLIPSISFYASIKTMAGTFVILSLLIYLLIPRALTLVWLKCFSAR